MAKQRCGRIILQTDVAQERQRGVGRQPHIAAQCGKRALPDGKYELSFFGKQVSEQLNLQVVAEHLPHDRGGHGVPLLGEVCQVGVAALGHELPGRVVPAHAPH